MIDHHQSTTPRDFLAWRRRKRDEVPAARFDWAETDRPLRPRADPAERQRYMGFVNAFGSWRRK